MFNGIVLSLFELQQATHASDKFPQRPHCSRYGKEKGRKREGKGKEKGRGGQERKKGSGGQDSSTVDIRGELPATISAWQSCADSPNIFQSGACLFRHLKQAMCLYGLLWHQN